MNPLAILGWVTTNTKTLLIIAAVIVGGYFLLNYTGKIEEAAKWRQIANVQAETIAAKETIIKDMKAMFAANNRTIEQRDKELEELNQQLEGILENLGDDIDDEAPVSLQELMIRLNNRK